MAGHDIIVVGASSGGMETLRVLVAGFPPDLPAAVFVVWHMPPYSFGVLPDVLARAGPLPAAHASDGEPIESGRIYVAPPDRHLLLVPGHVRLTRGPKENHFRPAVDPLFRSAAAVYGPRVIGVVLSGSLDDGTAGLWTIKDRGGLAVVQDPDDALFPSMPSSALEHVDVDVRAPVAELGAVLARLARVPATETGERSMSKELEIENRIAMEDNALKAGVTTLGTPSLYTCPECHGVLIQLSGASPLRFRCHTGHAFTADTLAAHASDAIEENLWNALRTMDENLLLLRQIADQLATAGNHTAAERLRDQARTVEQQTQAIRKVVLEHGITESKTPEPSGAL
jgi:two-component system chemotaxis response regulator CheB